MYRLPVSPSLACYPLLPACGGTAQGQEVGLCIPTTACAFGCIADGFMSFFLNIQVTTWINVVHTPSHQMVPEWCLKYCTSL